MTADELADYLRENYGTCSAERCMCRARAWIGTACRHFVSFNATDYDALGVCQSDLVAKTKGAK